jgi:hypothetical protein
MKLSIDTWDGMRTSSEDFESTDVNQVDALIHRLDQDRHTIVSVGEAGTALLMVGGGKGDYLVTASLDGENWSTLAMGPRDGMRKIVSAGGQPGDYHSSVVVMLDQAIAAARYFFLHGALDPSMTWVTYQG